VALGLITLVGLRGRTTDEPAAAIAATKPVAARVPAPVQQTVVPTAAPAAVVPTTAVAPVVPAAPQPQELLDAALRRLPPGLWEYLSARGWTMQVAGAMHGYVAGTWRDRKTAALLFRPGMTLDDVVGDVAHEVGHMIDFECFTDLDRTAILAARGHVDAVWFPASNDGDDRRWGDGDWAETFAETVTGRWDGLWPNPGISLARLLVATHGCAGAR
jgi:hypothetical protein